MRHSDTVQLYVSNYMPEAKQAKAEQAESFFQVWF